MALVWKREGRHIVDGLPFVVELASVEGGYRVRIQFDGRPHIECGRVWKTREEAMGRACQLADEAIAATLH